MRLSKRPFPRLATALAGASHISFFVVIAASWIAGCGGSKPPSTAVPKPETYEARAIVPLRRQACDGSSEKDVDVNGDGYANVRHVYDGGHEVCAEVDLNLDGRVDLMRKFAASGQISYEQSDFDFDGKLDQQAYYENGKLARKELDTNFDRMADTFVWCAGPYIARLERDRNRSGRVNTWEEYENGLMVRAAYDSNNDGKPDRWETYQAGRLVGVQVDDNYDGKPDPVQPTATPSTGPAPEPQSCDGSLVSSAKAAAAKAGESDQEQEAPPGTDIGVDTRDEGAAVPITTKAPAQQDQPPAPPEPGGAQ